MTRNQSIAVSLTLVVAVLAAVAGVTVFLIPTETLARIDTRLLRGLLFLCIALFAALVGLNLYGLWYDPPPVRMARRIIHYVMAVGATATLSPFALLGLQRFEGFGIIITVQEASLCSAVTISSCFVAGTLASYVLGDSVTQFSLVIGIYLSALGVGAWLSGYIDQKLARVFIETELAVALIGGASGPFLFIAFGQVAYFQIVLFGTVFVCTRCRP